MPFTPTHVLAVLPIAVAGRRWLPFSALAIGGMSPDWPLFVPIGFPYALTHSIVGLFTACLPLGLMCFLCFQILMKRPLIALSPRPIRRRTSALASPCLGPGGRGRLAFWAGVCAAIVIGAATHVFWDSFTHGGRWGTRLVPSLADEWIVFGRAIPGWHLLQYASSLVGLPALAVFATVWLARREVGEDLSPGLPMMARAAGWVVFLVVPAIVGWRARDGVGPVEGEAFRAVTAGGFALLVVTLGYCGLVGLGWLLLSTRSRTTGD